jgi:hypothetical protein
MARAKGNSNGRLEDAVATLIQNQASFLARMAEMDRLSAERFARIETLLIEHNQILAEHNRILQALPDAIRQKIGFKVPEPG